MIQVIAGKKGSGKTKRLLQMTNDLAKSTKGDLVFVDVDNRYMYDVDRSVRFVNVEEYHVDTTPMFVGFLCGMLSQNFDIATVFVDGFRKLVKEDISELEGVFKTLEELGKKHSVDFVLSVSEDPEALPSFMKNCVI